MAHGLGEVLSDTKIEKRNLEDSLVGLLKNIPNSE
jgi:hypothetical protein